MWDAVKKPVYIAIKIGTEKINGVDHPLYDVPAPYRMNVQPLSSYLEITQYGASATSMRKAVVSAIEFGSVLNDDTLGSRAYLDGRVPGTEAEHGENANYEIVGVRHYNRSLHIYFEKRKGE